MGFKIRFWNCNTKWCGFSNQFRYRSATPYGYALGLIVGSGSLTPNAVYKFCYSNTVRSSKVYGDQPRKYKKDGHDGHTNGGAINIV
nr:hypothetical protein [Tanacetum cinerariifolium]